LIYVTIIDSCPLPVRTISRPVTLILLITVSEKTTTIHVALFSLNATTAIHARYPKLINARIKQSAQNQIQKTVVDKRTSHRTSMQRYSFVNSCLSLLFPQHNSSHSSTPPLSCSSTHHFFFPFALLFPTCTELVDSTLPARDVFADVALLPFALFAPLTILSSFLFYLNQHPSLSNL
jgi:hypothetical protein